MKRKLFLLLVFFVAEKIALAQTGVFYPHRVKEYKSITISNYQPDAELLEWEAARPGSKTNENAKKIKDNFYSWNTINDFTIIKDENSFFIITCNLREHCKFGKNLEVYHFYYFNKDKKALKNINHEALNAEALELVKQNIEAYKEKLAKEDAAEKASKARSLSKKLKSLPKYSFSDQAESKKLQSFLFNDLTEKNGKDYKILSTFFSDNAYELNRNKNGNITDKSVKVLLVVQNESSNKCYLYFAIVGYENLGGAFNTELSFMPYASIEIENEKSANFPYSLKGRYLHELNECEF